MSFHPALQLQERTDAEPMVSNAILQCKCDCGGHSFDSGEFTGFNSPGQWFNPASIDTFAASRFCLDFSHVPLHAKETHQVLPSRRAPLAVQRFPKNEDELSASCPTCPKAESTEASPTAEPTAEETEPVPEDAPTPAETEPTPESASPEETPAPGFIVEDSAEELGPGQMRKSEFLAELQAEVTRTAEAALAGTGRTTADCPYLHYWFGYYSRKDSAHIERAIHKYAPETKNATTARGYIPIIAARVSLSVERWAKTGEITGLPEGMPLGLPGMGLLGGLGSLISGIGSIFFKAREGGARKGVDPRAVQRQLGSGQSLDSGVRTRMESAFGRDFSHVRAHTDTTAAGLSNDFNARAFTVGEHIAFGAGEYQPGTLMGDALIAHEMAHVVQQSGGTESAAQMKGGDTTYNSLEDDADKSALGAVSTLFSGIKETTSDIKQNAVPRLKSGLRLHRCGRSYRVSDTPCNKTVKNITVDLIKMREASGSPESDLEFANKAYKTCCVKFTNGINKTVPDDLSDKWLDGDTELKWDNTCGGVHDEEKAMWNGATEKYNLSSHMRVFYVATLNPATALGYSTPPFCAIGDEAPYVNHAVIPNRALKDTLAHEFGHILLNSDKEEGIDNPSDTENLMKSPGRTGSVLDESQCKIIYKNA